jgi:hypothetical protein
MMRHAKKEQEGAHKGAIKFKVKYLCEVDMDASI